MMRDLADNVVIICSIENVDPMVRLHKCHSWAGLGWAGGRESSSRPRFGQLLTSSAVQ